MLEKIHYVTLGNYGVAIMLLVILVRLALHPLTRYSQVNMARFQKQLKDIKPELDKIKKKYKGTELREEQMKLYKEKNVNQLAGMLGCLPMLLQMPIWIALYSGLAADIHLRHAAFIPGWINDLSMPDTLMRFVVPFHIWILGYTRNGVNWLPINPLPILLGIAFFFQMRYQMKSQPAPADEQQAQMQKLSQYSILLFPLFLYNEPSGLNLYICASTAGGLLDTWLVRKQLFKEGLLPQTKKQKAAALALAAAEESKSSEAE
jgi:YidC/Oxa1 family membrane protein insertase